MKARVDSSDTRRERDYSYAKNYLSHFEISISDPPQSRGSATSLRSCPKIFLISTSHPFYRCSVARRNALFMHVSRRGLNMDFRKWIVLGVVLGAGSVAQAKPVRAILRLKERVSMEQLAADVVNPVSPRYGQYYSSE